MDVAKPGAPLAPDNKLHFLDYWRVIRIRIYLSIPISEVP
jgi:hypothetical protein